MTETMREITREMTVEEEISQYLDGGIKFKEKMVGDLVKIFRNQLQSVFEEIEKTADYLQHRKEQELHGDYDDADFLQAYELGLTDLKWKLKSLRQKYISGEKEER